MSQQILTVMTRKGQITVPAAIRRALNLKVGDKIALFVREGAEGEAVLRPVRSVAEATYGVAGSDGPPENLATMRNQFEEGLAEDAVDAVTPARATS